MYFIDKMKLTNLLIYGIINKVTDRHFVISEYLKIKNINDDFPLLCELMVN